MVNIGEVPNSMTFWDNLYLFGQFFISVIFTTNPIWKVVINFSLNLPLKLSFCSLVTRAYKTSNSSQPNSAFSSICWFFSATNLRSIYIYIYIYIY